MAIPACGRIVTNQDETPQDCADAYMYRAGSYFAQGDFDRAIADYGEATKLAPRNVVAWVSQAIIASRLDPNKVAEIAAASAEVEQISALPQSPPK